MTQAIAAYKRKGRLFAALIAMSALLFTALFGSWHAEIAAANATQFVAVAVQSDATMSDVDAGDEIPAPVKLALDCAFHCDQHGRAMPPQLRVEIAGFPPVEPVLSLRDAGTDLGLIYGLLEPPKT
jgi:hypothetical protein